MDWHSWTNCFTRFPCDIHCRVSSTGGKVLRWSHWSLLPTAVCPENVYSSFDPVKLAKVLTGILEIDGFPGLEEPFSACCQWLFCNAFTQGHFWCHHCIPWLWKCGFWCTICHTFDILDHLIMRYCVDVGHLGKWRRVLIADTSDDIITQFRDPHTPLIDCRHADKCWYSAACTFLFWGISAATLDSFQLHLERVSGTRKSSLVSFFHVCASSSRRLQAFLSWNKEISHNCERGETAAKRVRRPLHSGFQFDLL